MSDMHMLRIMIECGSNDGGASMEPKAQSKLVKEVEYHTTPLLTLVKQNTSDLRTI
jgi:hypothetical protein